MQKQRVVAWALTPEAGQSLQSFKTLTADGLRLADGLRPRGMRPVALESTGVYWKPLFNRLEGAGEGLLVNARPIQVVPGGKTEVKAAEGIAQLGQPGLLKASFIPAAPQPELRELTR